MINDRPGKTVVHNFFGALILPSKKEKNHYRFTNFRLNKYTKK